MSDCSRLEWLRIEAVKRTQTPSSVFTHCEQGVYTVSWELTLPDGTLGAAWGNGESPEQAIHDAEMNERFYATRQTLTQALEENNAL